jgi:HPt (histidine-containing phosphotransfer) domain-containing protein
MTAAAMPTDRERCLQAGMNDFLAKPFRVEDVVAVLLKSPAESPEPASISAGHSSPSSELPSTVPLDDQFSQSALASLHAAFGSQHTALLTEVITAYTEDTPRQLAAMQQAAEAKDAEALALAAHSLKSASQIVGANMPARLSAEIEVLARDNRVAEASAQLPALMALVQRVMDQLVVWLQSSQ